MHGYRVIIQPTGLLALWCITERKIVLYDATPEELLGYLTADKRLLSWGEALEEMAAHHGRDHVEAIVRHMRKEDVP